MHFCSSKLLGLRNSHRSNVSTHEGGREDRKEVKANIFMTSAEDDNSLYSRRTDQFLLHPLSSRDHQIGFELTISPYDRE